MHDAPDVPLLRSALHAAILAGAVLVTGCSSDPNVTTGPTANPNAARDLLVATAAQGPVPLVVDKAPPALVGGPLQIAGTASNATAWLGASFTPVASPAADVTQRRVVFRFETVAPDPAAVCAGTAGEGTLPPPPARLFAVYCDGARPVADATGTATDDGTDAANALVASVTNRLFPGNSTAGYSNSAPGLSFGLGVGRGSGGGTGWGVGSGLFF